MEVTPEIPKLVLGQVVGREQASSMCGLGRFGYDDISRQMAPSLTARSNITETRQFVFSEWDPTAKSDLEALRSFFDSNGDGVFDSSDAKWTDFKVMVTNPDGSTTAKTLAELGITSIDLTGDTTHKELADGSVITSETTFTKSDGSTGTVADTELAYDRDNIRVEKTESVDANGVRTAVTTGYNADGSIDFEVTSVTSADGSSVINSWDKDGDGVVDLIQTITTNVDGSGNSVETVTNKTGSDPATAIVANITVTTKSADGQADTVLTQVIVASENTPLASCFSCWRGSDDVTAPRRHLCAKVGLR